MNKKMLDNEIYGKHVREMNTTFYNVSYIVDSFFWVNMKNCTHYYLKMEHTNEKKCMDILKASFNKTQGYTSLKSKMKV